MGDLANKGRKDRCLNTQKKGVNETHWGGASNHTGRMFALKQDKANITKIKHNDQKN